MFVGHIDLIDDIAPFSLPEMSEDIGKALSEQISAVLS